jgi:hypothetical protein
VNPAKTDENVHVFLPESKFLRQFLGCYKYVMVAVILTGVLNRLLPASGTLYYRTRAVSLETTPA